MKKKIVIMAVHTLNFNGQFRIVGGVERLMYNLIKLLSTEYECIIYHCSIKHDKVNMYQFDSEMQGIFNNTIIKNDDILTSIQHNNPKCVIFMDRNLMQYFSKDIIEEIKNKYESIYYAQNWDPKWWEKLPEASNVKNLKKVICNSKAANIDITGTTDKILDIGGTYNDEIFYNKNYPRENTAIYAGRIAEGKNLTELASIWGEIYQNHGTKLKIVGGSNNVEYLKKIKSYINKDSGIEIINWADDITLSELYNTSKFFINPSKNESFCCSLVEAMACGNICIINGDYKVFKKSSITKYIVGNCEMYTNGLIDFITYAIKHKIYDSEQEIWIKNNYSLSNIGTKILEFIRE